MLAGVGVSWYQWLEQGRDITVSPQVLDAVARVLRLNDAERRHLYVLAGLNPPLTAAWNCPQLTDDLERLVEGWMPKPAHLIDRLWNLISTNESARLVLGYQLGQNDNCLASFFLDPMFRTIDRNWSATARIVVAQYRSAMSQHPGDEGFTQIVDDLAVRSSDFAELWALHEARPAITMRKVLDHPTAGELRFESTQLQIPGQSELIMVFHNPVAGSGTTERVERLIAEAPRRLTVAI